MPVLSSRPPIDTTNASPNADHAERFNSNTKRFWSKKLTITPAA